MGENHKFLRLTKKLDVSWKLRSILERQRKCDFSWNRARIAANVAAQNPLVVKNALSIRFKSQFRNIIVSSIRANQKVGVDDAVEREQVKNIVFNPRAVAFFVDRFFDLVFCGFASREFEFTRFYVGLKLKKG